MNTRAFTEEHIKKKILDNFVEYAKIFTPFQSDFLSGLYNRYKCLDNGSIVLYFAKKTQQAILRKKDYDLNYDLSFKNFWLNHGHVKIPPTTILNIAKDINLPKETTRRKLSELTKQRILSKKNKHILWLPSEEYKENYNQFVYQEIKNMAKLTKFVTDKIDLNFSTEEIIEEYKKRFSFYWFHYLDLQLKWMNVWKLRFNDLEIPLIFLQFAVLLSSRLKRYNIISHNKLFETSDVVVTGPGAQNVNVSVSATSISEVTGIPRATCIRKLNQMVKQKILTQDKNTKRFFIIPEALSKNLVSKELTEKATEIYSKFYSIFINSLKTKTSH